MQGRGKGIAGCFYPTTVALVDDNASQISSIQLELDKKYAAYRVFTNPVQFLNFFTKEYKPSGFTRQCLSWLEADEFDHQTVDFNVRGIHRQLYYPERFQEISVMVIDYAMPELNGLEVCEALRNYPVKKLMLTGEADESLAVEAFNAGLIDKFIRKDTRDFAKKMNEVLFELQTKYFEDLTSLIVQSVVQNPHQVSGLQERMYLDVVLKLFKERGLTEYYLMDEFGSILFLDDSAKPLWIAIKPEEEMRQLYQGLKDISEEAPVSKEVLEAIKRRRKVPYFHTESDFQIPEEKWGPYLHPATPIKGDHVLYYALIEKGPYQISPKDILSYKEYIRQSAAAQQQK